MPNLFDISLAAIGFAYLVFIIGFAFVFVRLETRRRVFRQSFRALTENLSKDRDLAEAMRALDIVYRRITERWPNTANMIRGPVELVEEFLYRYDTLDEKEFRSLFQVERNPTVRNRADHLLQMLRIENPFAGVSANAASLLRNLQEAVEGSNVPLARGSLLQLGSEIARLEGIIRTQSERQVASFLVSVIGVGLTIVFGIVSLILYFR